MHDTEIRRSAHHWCIRIRDGQRFEEVRCPEWAQSLAREISPQAKVRLGTYGKSDGLVEVVLLDRQQVDSRERAETVAKRITEVIER